MEFFCYVQTINIEMADNDNDDIQWKFSMVFRSLRVLGNFLDVQDDTWSVASLFLHHSGYSKRLFWRPLSIFFLFLNCLLLLQRKIAINYHCHSWRQHRRLCSWTIKIRIKSLKPLSAPPFFCHFWLTLVKEERIRKERKWRTGTFLSLTIVKIITSNFLSQLNKSLTWNMFIFSFEWNKKTFISNCIIFYCRNLLFA